MKYAAVSLRRSLLPCVILLGVLTPRSPAAEQALLGADQFIEQEQREWRNVGAAIAIVQGANIIYAKGFGVREINKAAKVDADTLFEIGSTSKAFTAVGLGMLVDDGKIHWDDLVIDHLPDFRLQDPWITRSLTIRDVLAHRSGIDDSLYPFLTVMSPEDAIKQLRYLPATGQFRDSFHYNNLLYGAAGELIKSASGMGWSDFIRKRILQPLGMSRTGTSAYDLWDPRFVAPTYLGAAPGGHVTAADSRDSNVAMPHVMNRDGSIRVLPWQSFDVAAPAGSIVSSAADMANWLIFNLNEGSFRGQALLRNETLRDVQGPQNLHGSRAPNGVVPEGYAFGWHRGRYLGQLFLDHGGNMLGFPAYVALLPESRLGIVILSNGPVLPDHSTYGFHQEITLWAFATLLGVKRDESAKSHTPAVAVTAEKLDEELGQHRLRRVNASLPLTEYAGVYQDEKIPSGPINVRVEGDHLTLRFSGEGAFAGYLEHWQGDTFRLHSSSGGSDALGPAFANFLVSACGKVVTMTIESVGLKSRLERTGSVTSMITGCDAH